MIMVSMGLGKGNKSAGSGQPNAYAEEKLKRKNNRRNHDYGQVPLTLEMQVSSYFSYLPRR